MKQITARQFRVKFPTLTEQVSVTLNRDGELVTLGTWTPIGHTAVVYDDTADTSVQLQSVYRAQAQADRDAILRKVNRSER